MLSRENNQQQSPSPFTLEGLAALDRPQRSQQSEQPTTERNKGRGFRRSGNACEIAAGASLNSAIIFGFHLMQVHPIGMFVALGVSHFYFLATAFGEGKDRMLGNIMTGASAGLAGVSALSEPIGEAWEAKQSRENATQQIDSWYAPQVPSLLSGNGVLILFGGLAVLLIAIGWQGRHPQRHNNRRFY